MQVEAEVGTKAACAAMGIPRATFYRHKHPKAQAPASRRRPTPERALSDQERRQVLDHLHSPRFVDKSPHEVYATLIDEDIRLCSVRTMYRILEAEHEVRERRNQCRRPTYARPELLATGPNQVWSWDITKLRAAEKWSYFYLYVLMDIYSRYVVGWMLAHRESGELAAQLITETCTKQGVQPGQIVIHADNGAAPGSKTLAQLYVDLGVQPSHSRPHVSNDNPFSEAAFKTLKYHPGYPDRFGSFEDALAFCRAFFRWYNLEHRHSGIAYLSPQVVHHGHAVQVLAERQRVLDAAYVAHPERFVKGPPVVTQLPRAVWINPPAARNQKEISLH